MVIRKFKKIRGKNGWIRIVEAFVSILLITGVVLIILNKGYIGKQDISEEVYEVQLSVLREIQLNEVLRKEIGNIHSSNIPLEWVNFATWAPNTKMIIDNRIPEYLDCAAKICEMDVVCNLLTPPVENKDIYAQAVTITITPGQLGYEYYRQLKLFCWTR